MGEANNRGVTVVLVLNVRPFHFIALLLGHENPVCSRCGLPVLKGPTFDEQQLQRTRKVPQKRHNKCVVENVRTIVVLDVPDSFRVTHRLPHGGHLDVVRHGPVGGVRPSCSSTCNFF